MTDEEQAIESLKKAAAEQRGLVPCASIGCIFVAQVRVHWPVIDGQQYPTYCGRCADWACNVLRALGIAPHFDLLPSKEQPVDIRERGIEL